MSTEPSKGSSGQELPKAYNPKESEENIYKLWEESGFFNPDNLPERHKAPFTIVLPPPNVTAALHMGSALMLAVEDIMIRFERMQGKKALWLPGTDHASIATETKFLKEKKLNRNDYKDKREEFVKLVNDYALENQSTIIKQLRAMGSSLDWSRLAYTLDEQRSLAVRTAFKTMFDAGLVEQDTRVINWDYKGQTTVSDDEIEYEERKAPLYTFKYSEDFPITIATTRPETKVGDTAVAVHPDDKRYKEYVGKTFNVEFAGTKLNIKIIADEEIDPEYGTGAVGVTPDHSAVDDEIAKRHNLNRIQVINEFDKMSENAGLLVAGKKTAQAREIIISWLKGNGLLEKEEMIDQNIAKAQRSGGIIESLPKRNQWFIRVNKPIKDRGGKTLKELMKEPIADGQIKILPDRFEKVYFHWIDNLRDWNISRQIWFGHRIPVWYCTNEECSNHGYKPIVSIKDIDKCPKCGKDLSPEQDTLDTWFSSGLWTFSTLGWPEQTEDLKTFHPTDVLETGYDILFFWIARMILMSQFLLGEIPFKTVYLHGLVRDEKNRKISKSLGNNIDPLNMCDQYGTDAVRMAMIIGTSVGNDSKISPDKFKAYKHFANKVWNISRFIIMSSEDGFKKDEPSKLRDEDQIRIAELNSLVAEVTKEMNEYKFYLAGEKIYHYIWHTLADVLIEERKELIYGDASPEKESAQWILCHILTTSLKLLHPFMPFITEEVYQKLPIKDKKGLLMIEEWPSK